MKENEIIEDRKYRTKEMIDGFNMGLNQYLMRALPFWETEKSNIWSYVSSVAEMEEEMNSYHRKNTKHKKKRRNMIQDVEISLQVLYQYNMTTNAMRRIFSIIIRGKHVN